MPDHPIDWDAVPLGARPDAALAAELGVTRAAVRYQRVRRGLPPCGGAPRRPPIPWDTMPLGRLPDRLIAERLHVSVQAVQQARQRRGISPCPGSGEGR